MKVGRVDATTEQPMSFLHGGEGPAVVFLHGVPGSAHAWDPVVEELDGVHVIVPDLLGFSASRDADDLHAEAQARATAHLLDSLEITNAVIVTHDFGGPVAIRLIEQRPALVEGLLLSSTNAFGDTPIPFPLSTIFWPVLGRLAAQMIFSPPSLRLMLHTGTGHPRPRLDPSTHIGDSRQARSIRTIFETSLRHLPELYGPLTDILAGITVPTEVLWGDRDPFFTVETARRTATAIPGARLTVLRGAGHFLPAERPAAVVTAIHRLLERSSRGPRTAAP